MPNWEGKREKITLNRFGDLIRKGGKGKKPGVGLKNDFDFAFAAEERRGGEKEKGD